MVNTLYNESSFIYIQTTTLYINWKGWEGLEIYKIYLLIQFKFFKEFYLLNF